MDLQTSQQFSRGHRLWARLGAFLFFAIAAALMLASLSGLHAAPAAKPLSTLSSAS